MKKRRQHYVWRAYLGAWAVRDQIACRREGKTYTANIRDVANQRDFYRLRELSVTDLDILNGFVEHSPEIFRPMHRRLIAAFKLIVSGAAAIAAGPNATLEEIAKLDELVNNTEEDLHAGIETRALPILVSLRDGNVDFLDDEGQAITFYYFLAIQTLRTKGIADRLAVNWAAAGLAGNARAILPLLRHILGSNMGWSLFRDRREQTITFLEASEEREFITSDQPVVNTRATMDGRPPEEFELYYPLSPTRAMLLTPTPGVARVERELLSGKDVGRWNALIERAAHEQIFARSAQEILNGE